MGLDDKIDNKAQGAAGKAKEAAGKATDDEHERVAELHVAQTRRCWRWT